MPQVQNTNQIRPGIVKIQSLWYRDIKLFFFFIGWPCLSAKCDKVQGGTESQGKAWPRVDQKIHEGKRREGPSILLQGQWGGRPFESQVYCFAPGHGGPRRYDVIYSKATLCRVNIEAICFQGWQRGTVAFVSLNSRVKFCFSNIQRQCTTPKGSAVTFAQVTSWKKMLTSHF